MRNHVHITMNITQDLVAFYLDEGFCEEEISDILDEHPFMIEQYVKAIENDYLLSSKNNKAY